MKRLLSLIALLTLAAGCGGDSVEGPAKNLPNRLQEAAGLRVLEPAARAFRTEADWTAFWNEHVNVFYDSGPVPAPTIDFDRNMVLGVFVGNQGLSGCSNLAYLIKHTEISRGVLRVEVGKVSNLGLCAAIVYPLDVMVVPKFSGRVDFVGFVPE